MQKPSNFIESIASLGVIEIHTQKMCAMTFLGSSFKTPSKVGDKGLQFSFTVEPRSNGIIILRIHTKIINGITAVLLLLEVRNGYLNLDSFWEPKYGVLVSADNTYLRAKTEEGVIYTNNPVFTAGECFVPDAYDLCLFVAGKRGEAYLLDIVTKKPSHAALENMLITQQREGEKMRRENNRLKRKLGKLKYQQQEKSEQRIRETITILISIFLAFFEAKLHFVKK